MKYHINERGNLVITATPEERAEITPPESDEFLYEFECLEQLLANSELEIIPEGASLGDLTSAPMLGILGGMDEDVKRFGGIDQGVWNGDGHFRPIIARWAYMDYQVRSFVTELIERGECEWEGGYADGVIRPTEEEDEQLYRIVRFFHPSKNRESEEIATDLTLAEAQEHCSRPDTKQEGEFFDGYYKQ